MAAPGGGRLWSEAWTWFDETAAVDEVRALKTNIGKLPSVPDPVKEVYQGLPDVSGGLLCFGCTGYIGEAVVFEAVRRGLRVTVFIRQKSVARFTGILKELKIQDQVTLYPGDLTKQDDVEKAMNDSKAECCISLLASPQVTDEQNIYDVDYQMSHTIVEAARKCNVKQLIYCSDTGVYQPALATQFHKLRIEGELMRCSDNLQWTIVRPTTYHPYVVTAIVLDEVRQGSSVPLFGSKDDVGNLAAYNPIAREDLGRFMVSCVLNQNTYGRVLAVGGPWSADNVTTLGDNAKLMIELASPAGKKSSITALGMSLADIIYKAMEAIGHFSPAIKKVATIVFYYTKYWSTVSHFSPGTGVYDTKTYTTELIDAMKKDPDAFAKFVANAKKGTTGSIIYPTPRNSWWDITQKSVTPAQMPMGAGDPKSISDEPRVVPDHADELAAKRASDEAEAMCKLRAMAPGAAVCIGSVPKRIKDEPLYPDAEWNMVE